MAKNSLNPASLKPLAESPHMAPNSDFSHQGKTPRIPKGKGLGFGVSGPWRKEASETLMKRARNRCEDGS